MLLSTIIIGRYIKLCHISWCRLMLLKGSTMRSKCVCVLSVHWTKRNCNLSCTGWACVLPSRLLCRWWQLKDFLFSPLFGEDEPILTNIQMGWNHQAAWIFHWFSDWLIFPPTKTDAADHFLWFRGGGRKFFFGKSYPFFFNWGDRGPRFFQPGKMETIFSEKKHHERSHHSLQ